MRREPQTIRTSYGETPAQAPTARASMDIRRVAWATVSLIVIVYALQWGEKFFVSLLLGIIIAYTLNPLVVWLERIKIPRIMGASLVMLAVLGVSASMTIPLRGQIESILDQLPEAASKLSVALTMQKVQAAAHEIEKAASHAPEIGPTPKPAHH